MENFVKKVLIVAPHFPPSNLAGVHRSRYLAAHLPKFGWSVKVLTVDPRYYEEKQDHDLEAALPPGIEVIRTRALAARPARFVGDIGIRSLWWHYKAICRLAKSERIDLLYISISPNYSSMLGPLIYGRLGIPYVIDYQDPWVYPWKGCGIFLSKAWFSYNLGRIMEPLVLRKAAAVTAAAENYYTDMMKRYSWLDMGRCFSVPIGFDMNDFGFLDSHPRAPYLFNPNDGKFHIVYAGIMFDGARDVLEALLVSLAALKDRVPGISERIVFNFIGTGSRYDDPASFTIKPLARRHGVSDMVDERPARVPYLDALNHLRHSHAVFIMGSSLPHYTPSKVFAAIFSGRPILAILHEKSSAVGFLKRAGTAAIVTFGDGRPAFSRTEEIALAIRGMIEKGPLPVRARPECLQSCSAEAMAEITAGVFDAALNRRRMTPS